jgi:hypothetical protein
MQTIYQVAQAAMRQQIDIYLELTKATDGLSKVTAESLASANTAKLFSYGIGSVIPEDCSDVAKFLICEFDRKSAIAFDVEVAICAGVYLALRDHAVSLYEEAARITADFTQFDEEIIKSNSHLLPIFQNALKVSKAQLQKKVGSASDTTISRVAAGKLAGLLTETVGTNAFNRGSVLQRAEITLEGIVRDLVGRVLLEEVVAHALDDQGVSFLRESEYPSISGVVYDIRADFVLPNHTDPIAFIEVRKSSSRHASLYAKDKMFSAINWKGHHKKLIGVVVVEGEWTQATLKIMSTVFDYVVPLAKAADLAKALKRAQDGDESVLRWIVEFSIASSPKYAQNGL